MQGYVDARKLPGASVLILQDGLEAYFHQTGLRDVAAHLPFERDTVARIYSMTKPVTSVALMMLLEEGRIHLDQPLSDILPEFAECRALVQGATRIDQTKPCAVPTLHQCLTHTAGFSYPFNPGVLPDEMAARKLVFSARSGSLAERTAELSTLPLAFPPGERWEYSVGIDVIGRVVEAVSGQSLDRFFADRIIGPLGMRDTAFTVPMDARDRFACLYTPLAGDAMEFNAAEKSSETLRLTDRSDKSPYLDAQTFSGGGGLVGTIDDYMKFAEMLRRGGSIGGDRLLSPHTLSFMMRNHLRGDIASMGPTSFAEQPMDGMGFGIGGAVVLDPGRARCPGSVGDFSWGGMASTFFWVDPVHALSVVFFTQLSPSSSYPVRPQLKALIHGALQ
ncbi:class A beta-lactamase-related serine hydrolase [Aliishimia ponticola]|uniref:Class A beta-lactamase-related serine hydrolase n=2 Tax=Aliishimia ponticola TaxID=2499833 RepID=A0A4S4NF82_9RHOB|nr:class A beta-lactamase-related serine hydrolase [Aliishimia ponticola]